MNKVIFYQIGLYSGQSMKTAQAWVFRGRWELFGKRGAIGRTPGFTERKMTSLEGKPNPGETALHHDWRTEGPQADAGLPAGPQSEYVVEALLQLKWDIKMLQFCFQKIIWSFIATTEPAIDSNKVKSKTRQTILKILKWSIISVLQHWYCLLPRRTDLLLKWCDFQHRHLVLCSNTRPPFGGINPLVEGCPNPVLEGCRPVLPLPLENVFSA